MFTQNWPFYFVRNVTNWPSKQKRSPFKNAMNEKYFLNAKSINNDLKKTRESSNQNEATVYLG